MPDRPDARDWLPGALTAAGITFIACIAAIVLSVLAGGIAGGVAGVLLGAPAVPVGLWVGSRARRTALPETPAPPEPPAPPDPGPVLAALEAEAARHRDEDTAAFDARIATAECDALGHVPPDPDSDTVEDEFFAWGSPKPLRGRPRCRRCGATLNDPQEAP